MRVCVVTLAALFLERTMRGALHVEENEVIVGQGLLSKTQSHHPKEGKTDF